MSVTLLCTIFYVYTWTCLTEIHLYKLIYISSVKYFVCFTRLKNGGQMVVIEMLGQNLLNALLRRVIHF